MGKESWGVFLKNKNLLSIHRTERRKWVESYKTVSYTHLDVYKRQHIPLVPVMKYMILNESQSIPLFFQTYWL